MPNNPQRELRGDPSRESHQLKACARHVKTIWYDGEHCPACQAEVEFLELTKEMQQRRRVLHSHS